jgi:hypothetical protein
VEAKRVYGSQQPNHPIQPKLLIRFELPSRAGATHVSARLDALQQLLQVGHRLDALLRGAVGTRPRGWVVHDLIHAPHRPSQRLCLPPVGPSHPAAPQAHAQQSRTLRWGLSSRSRSLTFCAGQGGAGRYMLCVNVLQHRRGATLVRGGPTRLVVDLECSKMDGEVPAGRAADELEEVVGGLGLHLPQSVRLA